MWLTLLERIRISWLVKLFVHIINRGWLGRGNDERRDEKRYVMQRVVLCI
jgi:hypothetical protein